MMRVTITGAGGRMGRMLLRAVHESEDAQVVAATERQGSALLGQDIGSLLGVESRGIVLQADLAKTAETDVVIDFSAPAASLAHAKVLAKRGVPMVIGTTGFTAAELAELKQLLAQTPVVMAANFSVGVNVSLNLIQQAAAVLGDEYDAEIYEAHHKHKLDAPSGTALAMGRALAEGRGVSFDDAAVYAREGVTGPRAVGSIGFAVVRAGNIVGDHKAMFVADEERVEIAHIAADRMVFARGAVRAAQWLQTQAAAWYDMRDVLGLK